MLPAVPQNNKTFVMSKLLILDDSADLLDALKYILEHIGYMVRTLVSPVDLHKEIGEFQPDLLILDNSVEGEDGREICKELRKSSEFKDLRVLVFSSYDKPLEDYEGYYADGYIEKPFELKSLIEKITSVLHFSKAH
jgi:DNA-binding response OmpR family regulator